jgi:TolB protein
VVDIDSGQRRLLKTFLPTEEFLTQFLPFFDQYALSHHLWSPGSDALVLPVVENGQAHILVVPADGSTSHPLAHGTMAFWSPR